MKSLLRRGPIRLVVAVLGLAAVTLVALFVFGIRNAEAPSTADLAAELGLSADTTCSAPNPDGKQKPRGLARKFTETVEYRGQFVFRMSGRLSWSHLRRCVLDLLDAAQQHPDPDMIYDRMYNQTLHAMSRGNVRFHKADGDNASIRFRDAFDDEAGRFDFSKFDRIVYTNKHGVAYNSMVQSKFGKALLLLSAREFARKGGDRESAADYMALGLATFQAVTDSVDSGGLRSRQPCDLRPEYYCSWYHAVTDRSRPDAPLSAGTLNKHLIVVRDLFSVRGALSSIADKDEAKRRVLEARIEAFTEAAIEGVNQLTYSSGNMTPGAAPNLLDFIPKDEEGGEPVAESWLYYSINPAKMEAYFLKRAFKNCRYHIIDITVLAGILREAAPHTDLSGLTQSNRYLGNKSVVDFLLDTYQMKLADSGLYAASDSRGAGEFGACLEGDDPLAESTIEYLSSVSH